MAELAAQQISIQSVYGLFREDKLHVNRRYQRKLVWTQEEKQKLIESILRRFPIPAILLAEKEDQPGAYEIIDGLQRLHTIVSYIETTFPTLDGKFFDLEHFPTAKGYAQDGTFTAEQSEEKLSQKEVSVILDYTLAISVMRNATEREINDVFDRINTYGHRLSDQERRQAGVQNEFSEMVREIACAQRGDTSSTTLLLKQMPAISIDLPMTKHGYIVQADEVFWVNQGILRATDLRDSADEQCIADIATCIVGNKIIERSKDALDAIYMDEDPEQTRILNALEVYGAEKFADEFSYCVEEILKVCQANTPDKLRDIIFSKKTTNAFPAVFTLLMISFHDLIVKETCKISDYSNVKKALNGLVTRIDTSRKSTSVEERQKNIEVIKALIKEHFYKTDDLPEQIYNNHTTQDIANLIRRSEIELPTYELKQGLLKLTKSGGIDKNMIPKVAKTICAIANTGNKSMGKILIGVANSKQDAQRVKEIDGTEPLKVGRRFVVGIDREAKRLKKTTEEYFSLWKEGIRNSGLSSPLKDQVLANIDYNAYSGLGVIVITIPAQNDLSYVDEVPYYRSGDDVQKASTAPQIADLAKRFK